MTTMTHTKGKWKVQHTKYGTYIVSDGTKIGQSAIASIIKPHNPHEANAKLIAAAPELLEALKEAKRTIKAYHGNDLWDLYDKESPEMKKINQAIKKAEGK